MNLNRKNNNTKKGLIMSSEQSEKLRAALAVISEDAQVDLHNKNGQTVMYNIHASNRVSLVEEIGGGEGDGEYTALIFRVFTPFNGQVYVQYEGQYSSWDDTTWYAVSEVEPRKVEVTQYFKVQ